MKAAAAAAASLVQHTACVAMANQCFKWVGTLHHVLLPLLNFSFPLVPVRSRSHHKQSTASSADSQWHLNYITHGCTTLAFLTAVTHFCPRFCVTSRGNTFKKQGKAEKYQHVSNVESNEIYISVGES